MITLPFKCSGGGFFLLVKLFAEEGCGCKGKNAMHNKHRQV